MIGLERERVKRIFVTMLIATYSQTLFAYKLPNSDGKVPAQAQGLEQISQGVSAVAKGAGGAVVFVSVSKTLKGLPQGMVDPFEFFFGPGFRRQQPREGNKPRQEGVGSGFIVDLDKGLVITNNHVIEGAEEIQLKLANGELYDGKIVGRDKNTDIAVVEIKNKKFKRDGLSELKLGDSEEVRVGNFVIALGAPFRLESSISFGVVSALGRDNLGITSLGNFIQTDAAINPGNSGGPLVNTKGEVIGVNTAIYSTSGSYAGIGFAVPSNLARRIAEQLINDGEVQRGYLGVGLQKVDREMANSLELPKGQKGALVTTVENGSPAAKGGIEAGDVIVKVNQKEISSVESLMTTIGLSKPGSSVKIELFRYGKRKTVTVKLASWNNDQVAQQGGAGKSSSSFGLAIGPLSAEARRDYEIESKSGVLITKVEPNSAGARAGLRAGDVILSVNGNKVDSVETFLKLVKSKKRPLVRCERSGQFFFATLTE